MISVQKIVLLTLLAVTLATTPRPSDKSGLIEVGFTKPKLFACVKPPGPDPPHGAGLCGMNYPGRGSSAKNDIYWLGAHSVDTIISLDQGQYKKSKPIFQKWQQENPKLNKMNYVIEVDDAETGEKVSSNVIDFTSPTARQLMNYAFFVESLVKKGQLVVTHCAGGMGRTGLHLMAFQALRILRKDPTLPTEDVFDDASQYVLNNYHHHAGEFAEVPNNPKSLKDAINLMKTHLAAKGAVSSGTSSGSHTVHVLTSKGRSPAPPSHASTGPKSIFDMKPPKEVVFTKSKHECLKRDFLTNKKDGMVWHLQGDICGSSYSKGSTDLTALTNDGIFDIVVVEAGTDGNKVQNSVDTWNSLRPNLKMTVHTSFPAYNPALFSSSTSDMQVVKGEKPTDEQLRDFVIAVQKLFMQGKKVVVMSKTGVTLPGTFMLAYTLYQRWSALPARIANQQTKYLDITDAILRMKVAYSPSLKDSLYSQLESFCDFLSKGSDEKLQKTKIGSCGVFHKEMACTTSGCHWCPTYDSQPCQWTIPMLVSSADCKSPVRD